jgi:hypothetical protein
MDLQYNTGVQQTSYPSCGVIVIQEKHVFYHTGGIRGRNVKAKRSFDPLSKIETTIAIAQFSSNTSAKPGDVHNRG